MPAAATGQRAQHVLPTAPLGAKSLRLKGVRVNSRIENGHLVVQGLSGSLGGGKLQASGRVDTGDKSGVQHVKAQFDDIEISEVLDLLGLDMTSVGVSKIRADGVVNLRWNGLDPGAARQTISGTATVKSGPGLISRNSPLLDRLADSAGISDPEDLRFTSGRIELAAEAGRVQIKSLVLQGPEFQLAAAGTVDLAGQQINMLMDVNVSPAIAKKSSYYKLQSLASVFGRKGQETNAYGMVEIPRIAIAGRMEKPEVTLDRNARGEPAIAGSSSASTPRSVAEVSTPDSAETVGAQPVPGKPNVVVQKGGDDVKHTPFWRNILGQKPEAGDDGSGNGNR